MPKKQLKAKLCQDKNNKNFSSIQIYTQKLPLKEHKLTLNTYTIKTTIKPTTLTLTHMFDQLMEEPMALYPTDNIRKTERGRLSNYIYFRILNCYNSNQRMHTILLKSQYYNLPGPTCFGTETCSN